MKPTTKIKNILKSPAATKLMDSYMEGFSKDPRLKMAKMMSVEQLLGYADNLTDEQKAELLKKLEEIEE
jgi:hypothetical protein